MRIYARRCLKITIIIDGHGSEGLVHHMLNICNYTAYIVMFVLSLYYELLASACMVVIPLHKYVRHIYSAPKQFSQV